jgi:hypothetical protein
MNLIHKLLGAGKNIAGTELHWANKVAQQLIPGDSNTFNRPDGGWLGTGPTLVEPWQRRQFPFAPPIPPQPLQPSEQAGGLWGTLPNTIPGVNAGASVPYVLRGKAQYGHPDGTPVNWKTEDLNKLQALPLPQPSYPTFNQLPRL